MRLLKIGRDASCDIVLNSNKVSSVHAEITLTNSGDILLEDKNSSNGTYLNNQAIAPDKPVTIRRGDTVRFADVELQWNQIPMPEDNSAYKAVYGIGTHFNNDIKITGSTVSRYHATIKVGKDNKVYIIDHSKNGTTVDGKKIPTNTLVQIKKNSVVVCGGVPLNLSSTPVKWPAWPWKTIATIAAAVLILCGVCFGGAKLINPQKTYTDGELYAIYNNSVVYLEGLYHFKVTGVPEEVMEKYGLPIHFFMSDGNFVPIQSTAELPAYSGTGFFISQDGKIITNLHVVRPWLYDGIIPAMELEYKKVLAKLLTSQEEMAYISQLKIIGVLDMLKFVPQGKYYSLENAITCRILSAGDNPAEDVALIQSEKAELPTGSRYVNIADSMDITTKPLVVGEHVYTIGFPRGQFSLLQKPDNEKGIQVIAQGGDIIQQDSEFDFGYNAPTDGGASGSPVFNKYGMLIGVHHAGMSKITTQGYNYAIKAKYIKKIVESPHVVK